MLSLPPDGELLNICAVPSPAGSSGGKVLGAVQHLAA